MDYDLTSIIFTVESPVPPLLYSKLALLFMPNTLHLKIMSSVDHLFPHFITNILMTTSNKHYMWEHYIVLPTLNYMWEQ